MRSDIKIRKRSGALAAPPAITEETLAGEETGLPRQSLPFVGRRRQCSVQGFNGAEADRYLGVDNGIDNQGRAVGTLSQCLRRPLCPFGVIGRNIQKYIAVDENAAAVA